MYHSEIIVEQGVHPVQYHVVQMFLCEHVRESRVVSLEFEVLTMNVQQASW